MCVAQLPSCWLSFPQEARQSHMVSLGTGFCSWTSVLNLIQSPHRVPYWIYIWRAARVQVIPARVWWKLHSVNWLQINLFWTVEHEELVWCTKASYFLPKPCIFAGSCHRSYRNVRLETGRFWMAQSYWITFCTETASKLSLSASVHLDFDICSLRLWKR